MNTTQHSRFFPYIAILFVAVLMISNTVAVKIVQIGPFTLAGAIFLFPISYIFGDVLTEVYGYRASRRVIWSGFAALAFMSLWYWIVQQLPAAVFWPGQQAYEQILGAVPRIVIASMIAYFAGEFTNSTVLSRMKVWTSGKHLWARTIGSTVLGEGVDSALFALIAFSGIIPSAGIVNLILSGYIVKVAYEVAATPLTYWIVNALKRREGIDVYDRDIGYNPFSLKG